jgi:outer membrane immunogenic protein
MNRFAIIGAGLLSIAGFAGAASAADFADRPAMSYNPFSWTGCYIGGNAGGVSGDDGRSSSSGFVGGAQIGCDYQFAPAWVVGVEGQANWTSLSNGTAGAVTNRATGITVPSRFTVGNDFVGSVTARLGYSFAERWLVFGKGGAAWTNEKIDDAFTTVGGLAVDPSLTTTRTGWTAGGGVEWEFAPHWSATLEYNYYDFGSSTGAVLSSSTNSVTVTLGNVRDTMQTVTAGLNYRF